MNEKYVVPLVILFAAVLWLLSGRDQESETQVVADTAEQSQAAVKVRAVQSVASQRDIELIVRGKTEENRRVLVRAEVSGKVVSLPMAKGASVQTGELLCEIAVDNRDVALTEARALARQTALEYNGIKKLGKKGLQAQTAVAKAQAVLESAKAAVSRAELALDNTQLRSPFSGIVEDLPVEVGDYLRIGDACALIIDTNPIVLTGQVAEKDIANVTLGEAVGGRLITGEAMTGLIDYISQAANQRTRSYRVEALVANPERSIRVGITSELLLPIGSRMAHHISPASLVLDDSGAIGVKTVNAEQRVEFHSVSIIAEGIDGIWVTGLRPQVTLIVVGQEVVFAGESVNVDLSPLNSLSDKG